MSLVRAISNGLFDVLLAPFRTANPWPGLLAVALFTAVLVLLIFRVASRPATVRRRRDRLLARVLELVLFEDDLVVNLGAFGRVLAANGRYLAALLIPLALSLVPVLLILAQADAWFGWRPLQPGETTVVTARFAAVAPGLTEDATLTTSAGLRVETWPVRVPSRNEVSWRVRVADAGCSNDPESAGGSGILPDLVGPRQRAGSNTGGAAGKMPAGLDRRDACPTVASDGGSEWVEVAAGGRTLRQPVAVGRTLAPVAPRRTAGDFWSALTSPRAEPLPAGSTLEQLVVIYPVRDLQVGSRRVNWVVAFFVLTLVFGFVLRKPLRVEL
ncbi:hypothetical protein HQ590_09500 [bacterium]|nr:hypothetical protein [bacterium]